MAAAGSMSIISCTALTGNRVTFTGSSSIGNAAAGFVPAITIIPQWAGFDVAGDIHGMLRFEFGDLQTFEGALTPADLKTTQIGLTQAVAAGVLALICEEVYGY